MHKYKVMIRYYTDLYKIFDDFDKNISFTDCEPENILNGMFHDLLQDVKKIMTPTFVEQLKKYDDSICISQIIQNFKKAKIKIFEQKQGKDRIYLMCRKRFREPYILNNKIRHRNVAISLCLGRVEAIELRKKTTLNFDIIKMADEKLTDRFLNTYYKKINNF
jgi:hypothetical protein